MSRGLFFIAGFAVAGAIAVAGVEIRDVGDPAKATALAFIALACVALGLRSYRQEKQP